MGAQQHSSSPFRVLNRRQFHTTIFQAAQLHQIRELHRLEKQPNLPRDWTENLPGQNTLCQTARCIPGSTHSEIMSPAATIDSAYDPKTGTWQYVVADPETLDAVVIDQFKALQDSPCAGDACSRRPSHCSIISTERFSTATGIQASGLHRQTNPHCPASVRAALRCPCSRTRASF